LYLLGTSLAAYIERIFLAHYSESALAGSLNGFFLARIFQFSTLAVIFGGQTFVGLFHGSGQPKQIGPCVWQLIWFSLATILIVPPVGFALEHALYHNTSIAQAEGGYFSLLCWFNFLIPLSGAFSAFYIGRGKTLLVVLMTLGSYVLNIGLDYIFIFGNSFIAPMGSFGASLGKVVSQGMLCLILGFLFFSAHNHKTFGTRNWFFQPLLFFHYIKPGFYRALGTIVCFADWSFISRTMSILSETHLLVFSIGATVFYFFTFFADAILQSIVAITAAQIGQKQHHEIWKTVYNGFFAIAVYSLVLCIPFFIFPESLTFCFKATSFEHEMIGIMHTILPSVWLALVSYGICTIPLALIVSSRDTFFLFRYFALFWLISSVPVYLIMSVFGFSPDKFWYLVFMTNLINAIAYFRRASKKKWLREEWQLTTTSP
jgi:MATE family multidrug resistance protein